MILRENINKSQRTLLDDDKKFADMRVKLGI